MKDKITISSLGHTWILDLDGTTVRHNGYKIDGHDTLLDGALDFLNSLPSGDMIVFITSRPNDFKQQTEDFLKNNGIRYDHIIFNAPYGERILINDKKMSGLPTSVAVNTDRDEFCKVDFIVDNTL